MLSQTFVLHIHVLTLMLTFVLTYLIKMAVSVLLLTINHNLCTVHVEHKPLLLYNRQKEIVEVIATMVHHSNTLHKGQT